MESMAHTAVYCYSCSSVVSVSDSFIFRRGGYVATLWECPNCGWNTHQAGALIRKAWARLKPKLT